MGEWIQVLCRYVYIDREDGEKDEEENEIKKRN